MALVPDVVLAVGVDVVSANIEMPTFAKVSVDAPSDTNISPTLFEGADTPAVLGYLIFDNLTLPLPTAVMAIPILVSVVDAAPIITGDDAELVTVI
jgi:hypothetical protein